MRSHKEHLNKHKVSMLKQAAQEIIATGTNEFSIKIYWNDPNNYNNFQKLRYHGLVAHITNDGKIVRGQWLVTSNGWKFLKGELALPVWVEVQDNHIVARSDILKKIDSIYDGSTVIATTFEYSDGSIRPGPSIQPALFDLELQQPKKDWIR